MTGTYLSERHGDTYQLWYIDADGNWELVAEWDCRNQSRTKIAHQVADVEADHRQMREQQETDDE